MFALQIKKGMFVNGMLHGLGTHVLRDGTVRTGLFQFGELVRRGYEKCPDGEEYEGDFAYDARHGQGNMVNKRRGLESYDGAWRYGSFQGRGCVELSYGSSCTSGVRSARILTRT